MSIEYKTIRVPPATYEKVCKLRDVIAETEYESLPTVTKEKFDRSDVTLGRVIEAALESLSREIGFTEKVLVDTEE